jgi:hypothetical protein
MRTALFPSGDGMLNFSAFYPKIQKIIIPAWFLTSFETMSRKYCTKLRRLWQGLVINFVITTSTASYNDFSNILKGQ